MMTLRRLLLLALLVLPGAAWAQTAPNRVDVVKRVNDACPGLILQDHAFTDAVATVLNAEDANWGRNGKRGNVNDPSHDAIAYVMPGGPGGVAVVDIIGCAGGGPNCSPSVAWIDQTAATRAANTIGAWVRPSGRLPACLTGGSTPPPGPTPTPVPPPPAPVDLTPLVEAVNRLEARLAAIEARPSPSLDLFDQYVDDMVGRGPADDPALAPNHVTDIKARLDVIRVQLEQLAAWLRSRPVLRF